MVQAPAKPDYTEQYSSPRYQVKAFGNCASGNYIEIYIPEYPYRQDDDHLVAVIYLHAFALGASHIYRSHLEHLVKQGYYVFFPSYQRGFCHRPCNLGEAFSGIAKAVFEPYPISPQGWIQSAIRSVTAAYKFAGLWDCSVHSYLFGHSLGGLFALSWRYYAQGQVPAQLLPQQVVAASPIPGSDSHIPPWIRTVTQQLGGFKDQVRIATTGAALTVPVAILHGNGDTVVPVQDWQQPFAAHIATTAKAFYLSFTDDHGSPLMQADHMQTAVCTDFFPEGMAQLFLGGVGTENPLNWHYIWSALDQIIRDGVRADRLGFEMGQWSDGRSVRSIQRCWS